MKLYLDEDSLDRLLVALLNKARHDLVLSRSIGLTSVFDAKHLTCAFEQDRVLLTGNYEDFLDLHELIQKTGGRHKGIIVIRKDNDPNRDMKPKDIARAIAKLEGASAPVVNEYVILNHWR
jgi:predicted nuclease of predicted toxin-antitoxin system